MVRTFSGIIRNVLKDGVTAAVSVISRKMHPRYKKVVSRVKNYLVDCDGVSVVKDQEVLLKEVAPISKRKKWVIVRAS